MRRQPARRRLAMVVLALVCAGSAIPAAAQSNDEVEKLKREIEELRAAIDELRGEKKGEDDPSIEELARQVEVLAEEIERLKLGEAVIEATEGEYGLGIAASKVYRVQRGISIGGYGEALYESFSSSREDGSPGNKGDRFDFLRAVLYFGYKFHDRWVFNSEIEIEHASTSETGSVSVEFAYIDYLYKEGLNARAGMVLVPMGLLNELHEPTLFVTARRPNTERAIIPSTWRENGIGIFGDVGGFSYRTYLVNGLEGAEFSSSGLRGGRQKGSQAKADDFAWSGRLDYTAIPGFLVGASAYIGDSGQGLLDTAGVPIDARTEIFDLHLEWRYQGLRLRGLYAWSEVDDVARLNGALGKTGSSSIGDELVGYYGEIGYDVLSRRGGQMSLIPFLRAESFNTQDSVPVGFSADPATDQDVLTFGLAFQPLDQLIFKLDYEDWSNEANTGLDQWNFALGYVF